MFHGDQKTEHCLHKLYKKFQNVGEWFTFPIWCMLFVVVNSRLGRFAITPKNMHKQQHVTNNVPLHHLNSVAALLSKKDVASMRQVCRHWTLVKALWRTLNACGEGLTPRDALKLCNVGHLHCFFAFDVCETGTDLLAGATNLRSLTFQPPKSNPCAFLARLSFLEVLNVQNTDLSAIDLSRLSSVPNLTALNISACALGPEHFVQLAQLSQLESLTCKRPWYAHAYENDLIVAEGLCHLTKLQLQFLNLSGCQLLRQAMESVAQITTLQVLDLKRCERLTDAGLECLICLPQLQDLDVSCLEAERSVSKHGLAHCAAIPSLRGMRLSHNSRFDLKPLFEQLAISQLTSLDVRMCGLDDSYLGLLPPDLACLNLGYNPKITDAGVATLAARAPNLMSLVLDGCYMLTDAAVAALSRLARLCNLSVDNCPKITVSK